MCRRSPGGAGGSHDTWEEAFEATFAIGVADFYESFEEHRREIAPPRVRTTIQGTVVGPDDQPLAGVRVFGEPKSADGDRLVHDYR